MNELQKTYLLIFIEKNSHFQVVRIQSPSTVLQQQRKLYVFTFLFYLSKYK